MICRLDFENIERKKRTNQKSNYAKRKNTEIFYTKQKQSVERVLQTKISK